MNPIVFAMRRPVTTLMLGAVLLAELPSPFQLAGVALVLFGIALATGGLRRIAGTLGRRQATA